MLQKLPLPVLRDSIDDGTLEMSHLLIKTKSFLVHLTYVYEGVLFPVRLGFWLEAIFSAISTRLRGINNNSK